MSARVTVLRGRTSDRSADGVRGAQALGEELAARLGVAPVLVGEPGAPREARWEADLRDGRDAIAAAGLALGAALDAGDMPVLLASDCTICMSSLPELARREPDAHASSGSTPTATSTRPTRPRPAISAACAWRPPAVAGTAVSARGSIPRRVVLSDARDLEAAERDELGAAGVAIVPPARVPDAVRGERVFVHVDLDVLDPSEMPFSFPAAGGLPLPALRALLAELAGAAEIAGVEVTSTASPGAAGRLADMLQPLIP